MTEFAFLRSYKMCPNNLRAALLAATLIFCGTCLRAQPTPSIQWEKSFGGSKDDAAYSVQQTHDGGYIIAGSTASNDSDVVGNHGLQDYWILKLDSVGRIQWKTALGGSLGEEANEIQQTSDDGYIVAGCTDSQDGDVLSNHGARDYWIVKLDRDGKLVWQKSFGGSGLDAAFSIQQTHDKGFVIAGTSGSNDGEVLDRPPTDYYSDWWIVKLDSAGTIQWRKTLGGSSFNFVFCVRQIADGGYVLAGSSSSNDEDFTGNYGGVDAWVVKLDAFGNILWKHHYGGNGDEVVNSIRQTHDGGFIATGPSSSNDGDFRNNHGNMDYFLLKLDSVGRIQWDILLGGSNQDVANCVSETSDGGYVIAGYSLSKDGNVTVGHGSYDYWIVNVDSIGNIIWQKSLGGSGLDWANSIQQTADGSYIVAGYSNSIDGDVTGNHGGYDYWIVKLAFTNPKIFSSQREIMPPLLCGTTTYDTLWVHNTGTGTLVIDSAVFANGVANYSLASPKPFPDSILPGDSTQLIIAFFPAIAGDYATTLNIYSSDSIRSLWPINISGRKDTLHLTIVDIANDTLDFGYLSCGRTKDTTMTLSNASSIATSVALNTTNGALFRAPSSVFLDTNSQQQLTVRFSGSNMPQTCVDSLLITDTCGLTKIVYLKAIVDSAAFVIAANSDTLICPNDTAVRSIIVKNVSRVPQQFQITGGGSLYSTTSSSMTLGSDSLAMVEIVFHGSATNGIASVNYQIVDDCGGTHDFTVRVDVEDAGVVAQPIPDIVLCPGDSNTHTLWIHNVTAVPQAFQLSGIGSGLFGVSPAAVSILPGDSVAVKLNFSGTPIPGTYSIEYNLPGCGTGHAIVANIHVAEPNVVVPQSYSIAVCPFTTATIPIPISNADTVFHILSYSSAPSTLSKPGATLPAGGHDTLIATFAGAAAGSYPCTVHIVDECGIAHDVTITVDVKNLPPLKLLPMTKATPDSIGSEEKVFVVVSPASALSSDDILFTVTNEPTALKFSRASSPCSINVLRGRNTDTITVSHCSSSGSDTIATLYYRSFEGATFAPWVNIPTVTTATACQTISAIGQATIALYPPGCELGTLTQRQAVNSIEPVYPNPATGMATIVYSIIEDGNVTLNVRDAMGRSLRTALDALRTKGTYRVDVDTRGMQSGIYLVRMQAGSAVVTREFIVLR